MKSRPGRFSGLKDASFSLTAIDPVVSIIKEVFGGMVSLSFGGLSNMLITSHDKNLAFCLR